MEKQFTFEFQPMSSNKPSEADFILKFNKSWNNYGYVSCLEIFATKNITKKYTAKLGSIQIGGYDYQKTSYFEESLPKGIFTQLPEKFFTWSFHPEFFAGLACLIPSHKRKSVLKALNFSFYDDETHESISKTDCYQMRMYRPDVVFHVSDKELKIRNMMIKELISAETPYYIYFSD